MSRASILAHDAKKRRLAPEVMNRPDLSVPAMLPFAVPPDQTPSERALAHRLREKLEAVLLYLRPDQVDAARTLLAGRHKRANACPPMERNETTGSIYFVLFAELEHVRSIAQIVVSWPDAVAWVKVGNDWKEVRS